MKVQVVETIEITDEERLKLGAIFTQQTKPKYRPSREEIKKFVWQHGAHWRSTLVAQYALQFEDDGVVELEPADDDDLEDLI